jgi:uncharacterized protein (TIGR00725 family)
VGTIERRPIVAILGSGREHGNVRLAQALGALVARRGFHLLTGGGRGVMADASNGFASVEGRPGLCIGILPKELGSDRPEPGYPNDGVDLPIYTHLDEKDGPASPSSRNPINVRSAWKILALAGGEGTLAELTLASELGKPVLVVQDSENLEAEAGFRRKLEGLGCGFCVIDREGGRLPVEECLAEVERFLLDAGETG